MRGAWEEKPHTDQEWLHFCIFDLKENVAFTMNTRPRLHRAGLSGSRRRGRPAGPLTAGPKASRPLPAPRHVLLSVAPPFRRLSPAFLARLFPAAALPGHMSGDGGPWSHRDTRATLLLGRMQGLAGQRSV